MTLSSNLLSAPLLPLLLIFAPFILVGHWLAIEGVQPQVPENPSQSLTNAALGSTNGASLGSAAGVTSQSSSLTVDGLQEKYVVKHHLSKEHQMYFETVTTCLFSKDLKAVQTALQSLKNDAGIQQLLPYLMQFIAEMVRPFMLAASAFPFLNPDVFCLSFSR